MQGISVSLCMLAQSSDSPESPCKSQTGYLSLFRIYYCLQTVLMYCCVLMSNEDLSLLYCKNQHVSILHKGNQSIDIFSIKITPALYKYKYCNYKTHWYKMRSPASCACGCRGLRSNGMLPDIRW